jgi:phosphatidate cytidylyltransferase
VVILGAGAWELNRLMRAGGYAPSLLVTWLLMLGFLAGTQRPDLLGPWIAGGIGLGLGVTLYGYLHGATTPFNDFAVALGTALYVGWMGGALISLRLLPAGEWWVLTALTGVFAADTGAYIAGKNFGKHPLAPRISPHKTWEGYVGGVLFAVLIGWGAASLWHAAAPVILPVHGLLIGLLMGVITPLGDLGVSAFKRQVGAKDASHLIPGHGGLMDRLDTVLLAAPLAYYFILWFV